MNPSPGAASGGTAEPSKTPTTTLSRLPSGELPGTSQDNVRYIIQEVLAVHKGYLPRITLSRIVTLRSSKQTIRDARIDFWLEGKTLDGKSRKIISAQIIKHQSDPTHIALKIQYQNAVVTGCDNLDSRWDPRFVRALQDLAKLPRSGTVIIPLPNGITKAFRDNIETLPVREVGTLLRALYLPSKTDVSAAAANGDAAVAKALKAGLRPIVGWRALEALYRQNPALSRAQPLTAFPSLEAAHVILANARGAEHFWSALIVQHMSGGTQTAFVLKDNIPLALVRYEDRDKGRARIMLNDRMDIEVQSFVKVTVSGVSNASPPQQSDGQSDTEEALELTVSGRRADHRVGVRADIVVMLTSCDDAFYKVATECKLGKIKWHYSFVRLTEDRSLAQKEIRALESLCKEDTSSRFHRVLLGENLNTATQPEHWLRDVFGCSQKAIDHYLASVVESMAGCGTPLNPEQLEILRGIPVSVHATDIFRGPPGTGKTATMAAIVQFLALLSDMLGVAVLAPSNGNVQRVLEAIVTRLGVHCPSKMKPQRIYRAVLE